MKTRFNVGDTIFWYCDAEETVHSAKVEFVNYAGCGYPDINYEVKTVCCGEEKTVFVNDEDAMEEEF